MVVCGFANLKLDMFAGNPYFRHFAIFAFFGASEPFIIPKVNRLIPEDTGLDSQAFNSTFLAGTTVTAGGKTLVLDYRPANTPAMSASVRLCRSPSSRSLF